MMTGSVLEGDSMLLVWQVVFIIVSCALIPQILLIFYHHLTPYYILLMFIDGVFLRSSLCSIDVFIRITKSLINHQMIPESPSMLFVLDWLDNLIFPEVQSVLLWSALFIYRAMKHLLYFSLYSLEGYYSEYNFLFTQNL